MAETVSELLVKIRPDGVDETADAMERSRDSFEDTADTASEQTKRLEEFSDRWAGAFSVIVTGLAVASAGLLSQVPILADVFAGLQALIQSVAYQMDSVLRPVLSPVAGLLFDLSNTVAQANGPFGTLVGILGTIVSAVGAFLGILAAAIPVINAVFGTAYTLTGVLSSLWSAIMVVVGAIATFLGVSVAAAAAIVVAIVALIAIIYIFREEIWSALTSAGNAFMNLANRAVEWLANLTERATVWITDLTKRLVSGTSDLVDDIVAWFADLADRAAAWVSTMADRVSDVMADLASEMLDSGKALVNSFIDGIKDRIAAAKRAASRLASAVRDRMPGSPAETGPLSDLDQTGPGLVETFASGMEASTPRLERAATTVGEAANPSTDATAGGAGGGGGSGVAGQIGRLVTAMQRNRQVHEFDIDGRTVARTIEPLLGDGAVQAGVSRVNR